jgi:hypothetical protein
MRVAAVREHLAAQPEPVAQAAVVVDRPLARETQAPQTPEAEEEADATTLVTAAQAALAS